MERNNLYKYVRDMFQVKVNSVFVIIFSDTYILIGLCKNEVEQLVHKSTSLTNIVSLSIP